MLCLPNCILPRSILITHSHYPSHFHVSLSVRITVGLPFHSQLTTASEQAATTSEFGRSEPMAIPLSIYGGKGQARQSKVTRRVCTHRRFPEPAINSIRLTNPQNLAIMRGGVRYEQSLPSEFRVSSRSRPLIYFQLTIHCR